MIVGFFNQTKGKTKMSNAKLIEEAHKTLQHKTNHVLHLVLTVLTGVWAIVWVFVVFSNKAKRAEAIEILKLESNSDSNSNESSVDNEPIASPVKSTLKDAMEILKLEPSSTEPITSPVKKDTKPDAKSIEEAHKNLKHKTNHVLHFILTLLTGIWVIVWVYVAFSNKAKRAEAIEILKLEPNLDEPIEYTFKKDTKSTSKGQVVLALVFGFFAMLWVLGEEETKAKTEVEPEPIQQKIDAKEELRVLELEAKQAEDDLADALNELNAALKDLN